MWDDAIKMGQMLSKVNEEQPIWLSMHPRCSSGEHLPKAMNKFRNYLYRLVYHSFVTIHLPSFSVLWRNPECHHHHPDPDFPLLPKYISSTYLLPLDSGCSRPRNHQSISPDLCPPARPELLHKLPTDSRLAFGEF